MTRSPSELSWTAKKSITIQAFTRESPMMIFLTRLGARYKSTIQKRIFIIFIRLEFVVDMKTSGASGYHLIIQLKTHVQLLNIPENRLPCIGL